MPETTPIDATSHAEITDMAEHAVQRTRDFGFRMRLALAFTTLLFSVSSNVVAAEKYGGVEIGAKGVKASAVEVDGAGSARTLKVLSLPKATEDVTIARLKDKKFNKDLIDDVALVVEDFIKALEKDLGVPNENIQVVASSGVPWTDNFPDLVGAIRRRTNKPVDKLDAKEEATLTSLALVPKERRSQVLIVDIGSGNTKGGAFLDESGTADRFVTLEVPFGTTTLSKAIDTRAAETKGSRADAAREVAQQKFGSELRHQLEAKPELARRNEVFLSGGCVWAFLTIMKPETASSPFPEITPSDIKAYVERVNLADGKYPEVDFAEVRDAAAASAAKTDFERITGANGSTPVFTPAELQSGAALLEEVSEALLTSVRKIYFDRKAVTAWITALITPESHRDLLPQALKRRFPPGLSLPVSPAQARSSQPPPKAREEKAVTSRQVDEELANKAYGEGYDLYWAGRHREALAAFQKALKFTDGDARILYFKGLTERALGDSTAAESSISQACRLESKRLPDSHTVGVSLVRVQGETRRFIESIKDRVREADAVDGSR
jgi:hypothetical protein